METEKIILFDPISNSRANLKKEIFLKRIQNVKALRSNTHVHPFFIHENQDYSIIDDLYNAINNKNFEFGSYPDSRVVIIEINKDLFEWFFNTDLNVIKKQIYNWMTAVMIVNDRSFNEIHELVYPYIINEIEYIFKNYYSEFIENVGEFTAMDDSEISDKYNRFKDKYAQVCKDYIGSLPVSFLSNPFKANFFYPYFNITTGFFRIDDWIGIIEKNFPKFVDLDSNSMSNDTSKLREIFDSYKYDTLERAEKNYEYFEIWKQNFIKHTGAEPHTHIPIHEIVKKGFIYLVNQENTEFYKIGWTENGDVEKRLNQLQTGNPYKIVLVDYFVASSIKTEKVLHNHFDSQRITGEWFKLTNDDVKNLLNENWRINNHIY